MFYRKNLIKQAFRSAIQHQIDDCINKATWPITCDLTGRLLLQHPRRSWHVDHYGEWPFSRILKQFLLENRINIKTVLLDNNNQIFDPILKSMWWKYHAKYADLRIVDATANVRKGANKCLLLH
jgi:hypothetical protein